MLGFERVTDREEERRWGRRGGREQGEARDSLRGKIGAIYRRKEADSDGLENGE